MSVSKNEKTGKWEVRVYYKDWTGTRKQTTKRGFATKREALEWERAFKTKEDQNVNMLFKDFVELYLADTASRIKRNNTLLRRRYCLISATRN